MPDDDPRDRFSNLDDLKEEYEGASNESNSSNDENDSMTETASTTSNDETESTDSSQDDKGVKASRENVQAYIPANEKEELEEAFRKIKALCNLSDRDEPLKNDFYAAAFRHGYQDLKAIAEYLDLAEAYDEYGEMVQT